MNLNWGGGWGVFPVWRKDSDTRTRLFPCFFFRQHRTLCTLCGIFLILCIRALKDPPSPPHPTPLFFLTLSSPSILYFWCSFLPRTVWRRGYKQTKKTAFEDFLLLLLFWLLLRTFFQRRIRASLDIKQARPMSWWKLRFAASII